jgi:hypothetical protein
MKFLGCSRILIASSWLWGGLACGQPQPGTIAINPPGSMHEAMEDLKSRRPLPGLPDLNKPVYIRGKALLCSKMAGLRNPNVMALLMTRTCSIVEGPIRVMVLPPADDEAYLEQHIYKLIRVQLQAQAISDGGRYVGWIDMDALSNQPN